MKINNDEEKKIFYGCATALMAEILYFYRLILI